MKKQLRLLQSLHAHVNARQGSQEADTLISLIPALLNVVYAANGLARHAQRNLDKTPTHFDPHLTTLNESLKALERLIKKVTQ